MVDKVELVVTDLFKKHTGKPAYKGFYSLSKRIYQDDGEIVTESFALDKENLEILRAKIMAVLIDELSTNENSKIKSGPNNSRQRKLP